jgi:hypothetical protein
MVVFSSLMRVEKGSFALRNPRSVVSGRAIASGHDLTDPLEQRGQDPQRLGLNLNRGGLHVKSVWLGESSSKSPKHNRSPPLKPPRDPLLSAVSILISDEGIPQRGLMRPVTNPR